MWKIKMKKTILVTGGAGFIGSNFILNTLRKSDYLITNLDALTYAGNPENLSSISPESGSRYKLAQGNICDEAFIKELFTMNSFDGVIHFAAESHVDRSIIGPKAFIETNITGTFNLLQESLNHWRVRGKKEFRFLHVSTDEVYGSLGEQGYFTETSPYDPSSPYSASKASSDHIVKAFQRTYGLPCVITNCSNNYGPYQFPEKLIPLMILNIIEGKPLPVYGDGNNVRDWLYVIDHCDALLSVFENGIEGETYNIGGNSEFRNIDIVYTLCDILDKKLGRNHLNSSRELIQFVADRPGHDRRYAIDATKIRNQLGWEPGYTFAEGIAETVDWYLNNKKWVDSVRSGEYRNWIDRNYSQRKGE
jgi:dTDP-glucose 4,6-dehydratase